MIYHVLPGDSVVDEFRRTKLDGDEIVCRECLIAGDVDAETLSEFWEQRAHFILSEYGDDEIEYHDRVADELSQLLDFHDDDEVNLWFEYEVFCSVNMWFCLWLLNDTESKVFRIEPIVRSENDKWLGFGGLSSAEMKTCFSSRTEFTRADINLGCALWDAYRTGNQAKLAELSTSASACFPYLKEVCEATIERDTRPAEIISEIQFEGKTEFKDIFPEFSKRAGVYGYGDLQVKRFRDQISSSSSS